MYFGSIFLILKNLFYDQIVKRERGGEKTDAEEIGEKSIPKPYKPFYIFKI